MRKIFYIIILNLIFCQCNNGKLNPIDIKDKALKVQPSEFEETTDGETNFSTKKFKDFLMNNDLNDQEFQDFISYAYKNNNVELLILLFEKNPYRVGLKTLTKYRYSNLEDEERSKLVKYFFPAYLKEKNINDIIGHCVNNSVNIKDLLDWAGGNLDSEKLKELKHFLRSKGIPTYILTEGENTQEIENIRDIPTYVFATDKNYLVPTRVAIHSLVNKTPGKKRIIVLKIQNFESQILDTFSDKDVQIFQWDAVKLMNCVFNHYDGIREHYNKFCNYIEQQYNHIGITIRTLFPVLFNRNILEDTGYLEDLLTKSNLLINKTNSCEEEPIYNFVWLDSDILVMKDLNDLYRQFSMVKFNKAILPQPIISTLLNTLINRNSFFYPDNICE